MVAARRGKTQGHTRAIGFEQVRFASMLAPDTVLGYLRLEDARAAHGAAIDFIVASLVDQRVGRILDWIENKCAPNR